MFSIVHPSPLNGPAAYVCAQRGCRVCLDHLMRQHIGLVHFILRRQYRGDLAYEDLLQEGRIALWQAVLHFDPHRGIAFSTYAGVAIERQIWHAVARSNRPQGWLPPAPLPNPLEVAEERLWRAQVRIALAAAVSRLPHRLQQVIVAAYGLGEEPPRSRPPSDGRSASPERPCVVGATTRCCSCGCPPSRDNCAACTTKTVGQPTPTLKRSIGLGCGRSGGGSHEALRYPHYGIL